MSEFDAPCPWCAHSRVALPEQHEPPEPGDAVTRCRLCDREYGVPQSEILRLSAERAEAAARRRARLL